jgi:heme/copper-type cytochrome/quinol oxidase subunit 2
MKARVATSRIVTVAAAISILACSVAYCATIYHRHQAWDHQETALEKASFWPLAPGAYLAMAVVPTYDPDAPHDAPPSRLYDLVIPSVAIVSAVFWTALLSSVYMAVCYATRRLQATHFI